MSSEDSDLAEESLTTEFLFCESIIENLIQDKLVGDKNEKLKECVEKLQRILRAIDQLSLFSTNDDVEELPTSSIHYLLAPAYLAYTLEEINLGIEKRATYIKAAKIYYRQFLESLLIYQLISFKLPWMDTDDAETDNKASSSRQSDYNVAANKRTDKINRLKQKKQLEDNLAKLRIEERRNNDESAQRQILLVLIRLWAIRAVESLSTIDEELEILEYMAKNKNAPNGNEANTSHKIIKPFIIAKSAEQKKVFGLGYPSIPTYTVDEWYDQMAAKNGFGQFPTRTITGETDSNKSDNEEEDDEAVQEAKRLKNIQRDEYKDTHRRGWGNTYNKG